MCECGRTAGGSQLRSISRNGGAAFNRGRPPAANSATPDREPPTGRIRRRPGFVAVDFGEGRIARVLCHEFRRLQGILRSQPRYAGPSFLDRAVTTDGFVVRFASGNPINLWRPDVGRERGGYEPASRPSSRLVGRRTDRFIAGSDGWGRTADA